MTGKIMDSTKLEDIVLRLENCSAVISELCSTPGGYSKVLAGVRDLLEHITEDLAADIDCADGCDELAGMMVPTLDSLTKAGYRYDQAEFLREFLADAAAPCRDEVGNYFAIVTPFIVHAYQCGREGRELETAFPFIRRT